MFTGIIETLGFVKNVVVDQSNLIFTIESSIGHELKVDQSVAHDGICLTVVEVENNLHKVVAIQETISKTALKNWKVGTAVNLERCLPVNGRFDGHIVQGHVDVVAICQSVKDLNGSYKFSFTYNESNPNVTVEKGSITVNGTSLTVVDSGKHDFSVCIIPYTFENTNFKYLKSGDVVNLEFDILGKYVARLMNK